MSSCAWYGEWFNDWYLKVYRHRNRTEARAFVDLTLKQLELPPGSRILDLCCGTGRHTDLFRRRGYATVGFDLSPTLLKRARARHRGLALVRGDMASLPFRPVFDAVVNLFTSFGYFEREKENLGVLRQIKKVLKPGGRFLLDLANFEYTVKHLVPLDKRRCEGWDVSQKRKFNPASNRVEKEITIASRKTRHRFRESVRLYREDEIFDMVKKSGLRHVKSLDGRGRLLTPRSPRMVIIGEAP